MPAAGRDSVGDTALGGRLQPFQPATANARSAYPQFRRYIPEELARGRKRARAAAGSERRHRGERRGRKRQREKRTTGAGAGAGGRRQPPHAASCVPGLETNRMVLWCAVCCAVLDLCSWSSLRFVCTSLGLALWTALRAIGTVCGWMWTCKCRAVGGPKGVANSASVDDARIVAV